MTSLKMDRRFTCNYFPCTLTGNAGKWFKSLRLGSILNFEQLKYFFLNNFMQLRKGKGDANSMMMFKQREGESTRSYYNRLTLATLNVPGHEEFLVTGAFAQGLLLGPLSKNMQGIVPRSREKLKFRVEKYLIKIEGEEQKEAHI
ncbi:uncharacterized protein LOC111882474 [Lactuca sativa]|uniref:uncharacterized protein LOC111882474 n=1 Tax=Lactuca sativa TaxID=4236 RepID=UPI000CD9C785|nr:uncharacterized protein LOC111882474 [Lactuca sativa]